MWARNWLSFSTQLDCSGSPFVHKLPATRRFDGFLQNFEAHAIHQPETSLALASSRRVQAYQVVGRVINRAENND